jgi:hypothetical protein
MQINLTGEEHALLAELLDNDYRDLKEEIGKTEDYNFQAMLRAREQMLLGILQKVGGPSAD